MTREEKLRKLEKREKRLSKIDGFCILIAFIVSIVAIILLWVETTLYRNVMAVLVIVILLIVIPTIIMERKRIKCVDEQLQLIKNYILSVMSQRNIKPEVFDLTAQSLYCYTIKFRSNDVDFRTMYDQLKKSLDWAEKILGKNISITFIYEYKLSYELKN